MTCDEAREAFSDLYDGRLSGPPLADLDRHLEACGACRADWDEFLKVIQAVAELGTAEPSPGFAARVRERIEAPTWWQRVVHAAFFPLQVKIPIQAVALALVAFSAVMVFQKSPEMQREVQYARPAPPAAESYRPAPPAKGPAQPAAPTAAGGAADDKRDAKNKADALRSTAAPERQAAPGQGAAGPPKTASDQEKDRADTLEGSLDKAKKLADQAQTAPAGRPEPPPKASAPAQLPAPPPGPPPSPAPVSRAPVPLRDEAKELGKVAVPAEAQKMEGPPVGARAKGADSEAPDARVRQSAPSPLAPGRVMAPAPAPAAPSAGLTTPATVPPGAREEVRGQVQEGRAASIQVPSAADLYSAAITEYARGQYDRAIESFRVFLAQHPRDARVPDARFRLGDAYFAQQRYAEAIPEFEAIVQQHPGSPHIRAALFRQGLARLALGDPAGCQILRDAVSRYPQAAEAAQAREALAARCP